MQNAKVKSKTTKRAMPHFGKPSEALVRTLENALKDFPMAERRLTFDAPSAMIGGKMFAGLHNDKMILRLSDADAAMMPHAMPFEPVLTQQLDGSKKTRKKNEHNRVDAAQGRAMKGWVAMPRAMLGSPRELNAWMTRAMEWTRKLPKK